VGIVEQPGLSKALLAETIGTFALVFLGAGAGAIGAGGLVGVALAHGLVVVMFAYAYGHISGTHINPAVTAGVWAAGLIDTGRAVSYMVFQLVGGVLAALALRVVLGGPESGLGATTLATAAQVGDTTIAITPMVGLFVEAVLTFFLVNTVLNAGAPEGTSSFTGVAVGFALVACILMGGPLTGASLNPARTLGPAIAADVYDNLWVYFVGPVLGGVAAGALWRYFLRPTGKRARG
jgi:MIP family channel proteins